MNRFYFGEWSGGEPHGQGIVENGKDIYIGDWVHRNYHGIGTVLKKVEAIYDLIRIQNENKRKRFIEVNQH